MSEKALFIRHQAKSGQRAQFLAVWEKHVKPRAAANPDHLAYYFCFNTNNPDQVDVFQLYRDEEAMKTFLGGDWYPEYLEAIAEVVSAPPEIVPASLVWKK